MRKSKLDLPHIKSRVVKELATGRSKGEIAQEVGLHRTQVSRFASREDIKRLIETETMNLLEAVPDAVENIKGLVRGMKDLPLKDIKNRELSYKASTRVLEGVGLLNTPTLSPVMVNITNTTNTLISPIMQEVLKRFSESLKLTEEEMREPDNKV